jgi:DNA-binding transcriptional MocR family regulator
MTALADSTVAILRKEILSGILPPGTKLAEAPVAKRLGVSRVPVREALVILANEGLVEFKKTGRSFVKGLSQSDFEEIYTLRLVLEPAAAQPPTIPVSCAPGAPFDPNSNSFSEAFIASANSAFMTSALKPSARTPNSSNA